MAFKPVTKSQNGQEVLVALVPAEATSVEGATLHSVILDSQALPEPNAAIRNLIDSNPFRAFNLHKLENGQIVLRTIQELQHSEFIDWSYNFSSVINDILEE